MSHALQPKKKQSHLWFATTVLTSFFFVGEKQEKNG
jgi:hypothetical protein